MNLTQTDWIMISYSYLVIGGIIALAGSIIVYWQKKSKFIRKRKR